MSQIDDHPTPSPLPVPSPTPSFWHSRPSSFLLGHRTTRDLPATADVVVIGSGITGAAVARYLSEAAEKGGEGWNGDVVMLEAREACWGATGRNGGHCQPLFLNAPPAVARFELRNWDAVRAYIAAHAVDCEWRALPSVRALHSDTLLARALAALDALRAVAPDLADFLHVVEGADGLERVRLRAGVPGSKEEEEWHTAKGALVCERAASLWPYRLVAHMLEACVAAGRLNLQTTTPVERVERVQQIAGEGGAGHRYRVVTTDRGTIQARHVVLATNGYTSHLLPEFADLIVPNRGQMAALTTPGGPRLDNSYGFLGVGDQKDGDHSDYLIQRPFGESGKGGQLMLGGAFAARTSEVVGETDDGVVDVGMARYLKAMLPRVMRFEGDGGEIDELTAEYMWTGIMGYSRDGRPWVGEVPGKEGLWLCAGYTGHGMPNAMLCGKAVVDMILAKERNQFDEAFVDSLVYRGDIPRAYVVSQERIERARHLPTVLRQNKEGRVRF